MILHMRLTLISVRAFLLVLCAMTRAKCVVQVYLQQQLSTLDASILFGTHSHFIELMYKFASIVFATHHFLHQTNNYHHYFQIRLLSKWHLICNICL